MSKKIDFQNLSVHDTPKKSPGFLLWHISTSWRSYIEKILKTIRLTHPQFVVLAALGWLTRNGDLVTQTAIGKLAGLDPNTLSQILKGLEKKRIIKRIQSTDGRAKNVFLTPKGADQLNQALPAVEAADAHFFNPLSSKELDLLIKAFQKLTSGNLNE